MFVMMMRHGDFAGCLHTLWICKFQLREVHHRHRQPAKNEQHPFGIDMKFVHYVYCILMEMVSYPHRCLCMHMCPCVGYTMHVMMVMINLCTCPAATQSSEASAESDNIRHPEGGSPPHTQTQLYKGLSPSTLDSN